MSGALAQHRTPNRPTGDQKFDEHEGEYVWKRVLTPSGFFVNGRPREYTVRFEPVMRHVLDYRPQPHYPSKHSRGRTFARNARQRRHFRNQRARLVQAVKSATIDANKWHMMLPG